MRVIATDDSPSTTGRSLVPVNRAGTASGHASAHNPRPSAAFLAQLVAMTQQAPQTRLRRRASAGHAAMLYAAAARVERPSVFTISM